MKTKQNEGTPCVVVKNNNPKNTKNTNNTVGQNTTHALIEQCIRKKYNLCIYIFYVITKNNG